MHVALLLLGLVVSASSKDCVDTLGRKGTIKRSGCPSHCDEEEGVCWPVGCASSISCAADPVPAWLDEAGRWRCNETFALEGGRFLWTDGLVSIQPQHCAPLPGPVDETLSSGGVVVTQGGGP